MTDLENLRPGEVQHQDASKFSEGDSTRDIDISVVSQACRFDLYAFWVAQWIHTGEGRSSRLVLVCNENVPEDWGSHDDESLACSLSLVSRAHLHRI